MKNTNADSLLKIIREENTRKVTTVEEARRRLRVFYARFHSEQHIISEPLSIENIPAFRIAVPGVSENCMILFFHGGGFMVGSTEDHIDLCAKLSRAADCSVMSVDYRLAPEYTFPAALNDCVTSYLWLIEKGLSPAFIVPVGISAGGNLVLSMFLKLRAMAISLPKVAVCISPAVDLTFRENAFYKNANNDWLLEEGMSLTRKVYLRGQDPLDPYVSPTYGNLKELPSIYVQAGAREILYDDINTFVEKAKKASVDMRFDVWEGMFHAWHVFASVLPEGQQAIDRIGEYIRRTF